MLVAHLLELLETIRENKSVFEGGDFKKILFYMNKPDKNLSKEWWQLVNLAESKDSKDPFYTTLIRIRNTGTYSFYRNFSHVL